MKRVALLWTLFSLAWSLAGQSAAHASDDRPIVAVFPVDGGRAGLSTRFLHNLADYLSSKLTESGEYTVVPRDQLKQRLSKEKKNTHKECFDQSCQIELGKELAAEKTMSTKVMKMGRRCTVTLTLYDLGRATTEAAATKHGKCGENGVIDTVDQALDKLFGSEGSLPPPESDKVDSGTDAKKYKRELGQAWARLTREVKRGTSEQKLEKYQAFLSDFPVNNPHQAKVQKRIDQLEAKIARAEAATLKKEETAAALAAKRARAKELKAAYKAAKKKKGSALERLKAWEEFTATYPDDNPYLKTASRKIAALSKQVDREDRARQKRKAQAEAKTREEIGRPFMIKPLMVILDKDPDFKEEWLKGYKKSVLYSSLSFRKKGEKEDPIEKNKRHFKLAKSYLDLARGQRYIALKKYGDLSNLFLAPPNYLLNSPQGKKLVQEARGNMAEAIKNLEPLMADPKFPQGDTALFLFMVTQHELGNTTKAQKAVGQMFKLFPNSDYIAMAFLVRAEYLFHEKSQFHEAWEYYKKVLRYKDPKASLLARYKISWCDYKIGDQKRAAKKLKELIYKTIQPENEKIPTALKEAFKSKATRNLLWMSR